MTRVPTFSNPKSIKYNVSEYSELPASADVGDLAWVSNPTGDPDTPEYKPNGMYIWNGSAWETDTDAPLPEVITESDVIDSKDSNEILKPSSARKLKEVNLDLQEHKAKENNPHSVTPAQVGNTTAQWNANKIKGKITATPTKNNSVMFYDKSGDALGFIKRDALIDAVLTEGTNISITRDETAGTISIATAGSTGEANTAENIGISGVGIFKDKVGVSLRLKKVKSANDLMTVTETANDEIEYAVDVLKIDHNLLKNYDVEEHRKINDLGSSSTDLWSANKIAGLLGLKLDVAEKGSANGVATLDGSGFVPASQLPSFVDDILEYVDLASFPPIGETGKIYIALDTNYQYRWSGSAYQKVSDGEVNTASNVGSTGIGIFETKNGMMLEFRKLKSTNANLTIAYNSVDKTVDFTIGDVGDKSPIKIVQINENTERQYFEDGTYQEVIETISNAEWKVYDQMGVLINTVTYDGTTVDQS